MHHMSQCLHTVGALTMGTLPGFRNRAHLHCAHRINKSTRYDHGPSSGATMHIAARLRMRGGACTHHCCSPIRHACTAPLPLSRTAHPGT